MRYELPAPVKASLAQRGTRLHHYLWHAVRNNWHQFTPAQRQSLRQIDPAWEPPRPRFNPDGSINFAAGESFLYMHRQMILSVNTQLVALGQPALVPWPAVPPAADDLDYPVPGRTSGPLEDPKSDLFGEELASRCQQALDPSTLSQIPLARVGAWVEAFIHDFMHMRWADVDPGVMRDFPNPNPANVNPSIPAAFDPPSVDWLGHPWSSHVNSVFWKLHGWVDQAIEAWRVAHNLTQVTWTDTWVGAGQHHATPHAFAMAAPLDRLAMLHGHLDHDAHEHDRMLEAFRAINAIEGCHIGFDYVLVNKIPFTSLKA